MNRICPFDGKVCMLGCDPQCALPPEINALATALPEEPKTAYSLLFPPVVEKLTENVSITKSPNSASITVKFPL
jgi:hypothetical protein